MSNKELAIRYDPSVIMLLGEQLYRQFPPVLNELLTNAYDANATKVVIQYNRSENYFTVTDNGDGMSFDDLQNKYLVIGRKRREDDYEQEIGGRLPTGRKGVGKLAPFGIAREIEVKTTKGGITHDYILNLDDIEQQKFDNEEYKPVKVPAVNERHDGTCIKVSKITLKNFKTRSLKKDAEALSKRFHKFDLNFKVFLKDVDGGNQIELTNDLFLSSLEGQFCWDIPTDLKKLSTRNNPLDELDTIYEVSGHIVTTKTPIRDSESRGIIIYARGKLVSEPGFFDARSTDQFHTYVTGELDIDWIDNQKDDYINTARQGISWDSSEELEKLKKLLQSLLTRIGNDWKLKRKESKKSFHY